MSIKPVPATVGINTAAGQQIRPAGTSKEQARDLSLVLFGFLLSKTERKRVLDGVDRDTLSMEFRELFSAVQQSNAQVVEAWFAQRTAYVEAGKDVIQAAIDALKKEADRVKVLDILARVNNAKHICDVESLAGELRKYADMLEGKLPPE